MGILGLTEPAEKEQNIFQRLFWPADHAGEVDFLGQQGFWICMLVAAGSFIVLAIQSHWLIAILTLAFFALGGVGVREHSTAAAVLVAFAYLLNLFSAFATDQPPGLLTIAAAVLLLANIRGTWIAARWTKRGDPDAFPDRLKETLRDKLVDQLPARIWPKSKVVFFVISAVYIVLAALGTAVSMRHGGKSSPANPPEASIEVSAPN
jgi:hypothetical protein